MHENTWEIVTFLINLMFSRLDKFDRSLFEGVYIWAAYIWDVNLDTYLGGGGCLLGVGSCLHTDRSVLTGFYSMQLQNH